MGDLFDVQQIVVAKQAQRCIVCSVQLTHATWQIAEAGYKIGVSCKLSWALQDGCGLRHSQHA